MWTNDSLRTDNSFKFLSHQELERKYNMKIPFTEYIGIITALPTAWKEILKNRIDEEWDELEDHKLIDRLDESPHPSRMLYKELLKDEFIPPTKVVARWNTDLGTTYELETLLSRLEKNRICTINNKLRSFNYNFFMRNIPYEKRLFNMKIKPSDKCQHCPNVEESVLHLYWTCPMTYRLWERLKRILQKHTRIDLKLEPGACLLGQGTEIYASRESNILINILCLLTKHYIHVNKCYSRIPSTDGLIAEIRKTYRIEKNLALTNNTPNMVNTKWGELAKWLEKGKNDNPI